LKTSWLKHAIAKQHSWLKHAIAKQPSWLKHAIAKQPSWLNHALITDTLLEHVFLNLFSPPNCRVGPVIVQDLLPMP
jgi:hypothetical protein